MKTLKLGENVVRIKTRPDHVADDTRGDLDGRLSKSQEYRLALVHQGRRSGLAHAADGDYYVSEDFAQ